MGVIRRITDLQLGAVGSTKVISISSSETYYQISTGMRAFEVANQSTAALVYYGQSNLSANSGIWINTNGGAKFWDTITDNFSMYFRVSSAGVSVPIIIQEYLGNG